MCDNCGRYKGRVVVDVAAKAQKKAERIARKKKAYGEEVATEGHTGTEDKATVEEATPQVSAPKAKVAKAAKVKTEAKKEGK